MATGLFISDTFNFSLEDFLIPEHYRKYLDNIILPNGLIINRIEKLATEILADYNGQSLMLVCVLKSSFYFFNQLISYMNSLIQSSKLKLPILYHFIQAKSYTNMRSGENIEILGMDDIKSIEGKNILLVEDIIDSGLTIQKLILHFHDHKPKKLQIASLLFKRNSKNTMIQAKYVGFNIPNKFVVGYGMDYNQYFRDLNHLCILNELGINHFQEKDNLFIL